MKKLLRVWVVSALVLMLVALPAFAQAVDGLPREQTLIAGMLTGRVGTPGNFNAWVGWKWNDRGMQNLANEPLWTVDFATGKIINSLAAGDPIYNEDFTKVTIPLREGVTWSDGVPFTADDVVFTVETLLNILDLMTIHPLLQK